MENMEEIREKIWKIRRKISWIVKRYGKYDMENYGRKASWIVIRYGQYGRKVSWNVKWYGQ